MNQPLVTVAIPLHRSKPFLHGLHGNCEALAAEDDMEIIVSDRHGLDDAINILESQWRSDPRFRFFKAKDSLNWVEHMNFLLAEARGRYFRWLPHDDLAPAGCLRPLVERLECDPRVTLAYAPPRAIDAAGRRIPGRDRFDTNPVPPGHTWTATSNIVLGRRHREGLFQERMQAETNRAKP